MSNFSKRGRACFFGSLSWLYYYALRTSYADQVGSHLELIGPAWASKRHDLSNADKKKDWRLICFCLHETRAKCADLPTFPS